MESGRISASLSQSGIEIEMAIISLIQKGGPVMYVLLVISVAAVAIALLKLYHFYRCGVWRRGEVRDIVDLLDDGETNQILKLLSESPSPVARVAESAIECAEMPQLDQADIKQEVQRVGSAELRNLESMLKTLSVTAHLSPLLGLLGTVLGMIVAFSDLESSGMRADPALLAGGIWEALLTTAFGLAIAIPCFAIFYYLDGEVDRVRARMKDVVARIYLHYQKVGRFNGVADRDFYEQSMTANGV